MPGVERLGPEHRIEDFHSGNSELDEWLQRWARNADRAGNARMLMKVSTAARSLEVPWP